MESVKCETCGNECRPNGGAVGYGIDREGRKHCYECCANQDRATMLEGKPICLYLSQPKGGTPEVTNWPGSARFRVVELRRIRHNMAREAWYVRFAGPEGRAWYGRCIGDQQCFTARPAKY